MSRNDKNYEIGDAYFRTIAETKSISAAASILGISQPALSAYLKKKEKALGVILIDRTVLPIELTEAGKAYLKYLDKATSLYGEFKDEINK